MRQPGINTRFWKRAAALALALVMVAGVMPWSEWSASAEDKQYGRVSADNVKVRKTASTSADWWFKLPKDWVSEIVGTTVKEGITWYKVHTNGPDLGTRTYTGYIHGDFFKPLTAEEQAAWLKNPVQPGAIAGPVSATAKSDTATATGTATKTPSSTKPTPIPDASTLGRISKSGVNFRKKPGGEVIRKLDSDTMVELIEIPAYLTEDYWFKVKQNGDTGYIQAQLITILSQDEADEYLNKATAAPVSGTVYGYIRLTQDSVNLRKTAAGDLVDRIEGKPVLAYLKDPVSKSGYVWYYVKTSGGVYGYVRSDVAVKCDSKGNTPTPSPKPTATPTPTPAEAKICGYVRLTQDGVNLRKTASGDTIARIDGKPVLAYWKSPESKNGYTWYYVKTSGGVYGYVRSDVVKVCDSTGNAPTSSPTSTPSSVNAVGYAAVTKASANLRKSIAGETIKALDKGTVWPMVSSAVKSGSYTWYPVNVNGVKGFLRSDVAYQLADYQVEGYLQTGTIPTPSPSPTPTPAPSKYLITVQDKVNLRASASKDAKAPYNVDLGTVFPYTSTTTVSGSKWYKITYKSTDLWVLGSCVKIMNTQEYAQWLGAQPTPTPTPTPTPAPDPSTLSDMAETSSENVLVRASGSSSAKQVTKIYEKGVIVTLTGKKNTEGSYTWYGVKLKSGTTGYIRGDLLRIYTKDEKEAYENAHNSSNDDGKEEASYQTLRKGSTGEAVKALQTRLKEKGYFSGTINGTYGTDTVNAVKAFQKANGLTADGIAGSATQHALYGTVPADSSDDGVLTNTIYPVEKIDWWTGGIQTLWPRGMNVKITDVKTGITFWVHRWSGANHADVEPLTAADTRRMCKIYGVSTSAQIASENLWQRRPLWVTVGTRTFAASMYGVPHNYPDGDTIANNDYKGQFCIHFTNSKTHTSNRVDPLHMAAIQYAYDAYWNKH